MEGFEKCKRWCFGALTTIFKSKLRINWICLIVLRLLPTPCIRTIDGHGSKNLLDPQLFLGIGSNLLRSTGLSSVSSLGWLGLRSSDPLSVCLYCIIVFIKNELMVLKMYVFLYPMNHTLLRVGVWACGCRSVSTITSLLSLICMSLKYCCTFMMQL